MLDQLSILLIQKICFTFC